MWYKARYILQYTEPKKLKKGSIKHPNNSSWIYLFLNNTIRSFQETQVFDTGSSDFHKLVVMVLKSSFQNHPKNNIQKLWKLFEHFIRWWFLLDLLDSKALQKYS